MDNVEIQMIELLNQNGRQSMGELAVKLGVGISTVKRTFDKLVDQQSIKIVGAVDPSKVGSPISVMMGLKLAPHRVDVAKRELGSRRCVLTLLSTVGRYDTWAHLWFKYPRELEDFIENEMPKIKGIERFEVFYLLSNVKSRYTILDPALIDSPDRDLISLLQQDGRRKNTELAKILKVSRATVCRQIKRLEKAEIIRFTGELIFGPGEIRALFGIRTKFGTLKSVATTLAQSSSVKWVNISTGSYDLFLITKFKDVQEMAYFITNGIYRIEGVEFVESSLLIESKRYYQMRYDEYWASKRG